MYVPIVGCIIYSHIQLFSITTVMLYNTREGLGRGGGGGCVCSGGGAASQTQKRGKIELNKNGSH